MNPVEVAHVKYLHAPIVTSSGEKLIALGEKLHAAEKRLLTLTRFIHRLDPVRVLRVLELENVNSFLEARGNNVTVKRRATRNTSKQFSSYFE